MNNYKEIKNLIHNEFKITKEDIQEIVRQTVKEEVNKLLNDGSFLESFISNQIKSVMTSNYISPNWKRIFSLDTEIYNAVCDEVSEMVKGKLELRFRE